MGFVGAFFGERFWGKLFEKSFPQAPFKNFIAAQTAVCAEDKRKTRP
jgi:hypothetical protein